MNRVPVISVLMPAYNAAEFISEAINSILSQTFTDFELIIIDDGSTDNTVQIIQSYTDSRIVFIKNEVNLKLIKTLNKGIGLARGKYIARMDADDISLPERFEKQISIFDSYNGIDIVSTLSYIMSGDGGKIHQQLNIFPYNFETVRFISLFFPVITHPGVMVRASVFKGNHYLDSPSVLHVEDFELWNRLFVRRKCICYILPKPYLMYRQTVSSINSINREQQKKKVCALSLMYIKEETGYSISEETLRTINGLDKVCSLEKMRKAKAEIDKLQLIYKRKIPLSFVAEKELKFAIRGILWLSWMYYFRSKKFCGILFSLYPLMYLSTTFRFLYTYIVSRIKMMNYV